MRRFHDYKSNLVLFLVLNMIKFTLYSNVVGIDFNILISHNMTSSVGIFIKYMKIQHLEIFVVFICK